MLIDSPRLSVADRDAWDRLVRYDVALAAGMPLDAMAERARQTIRDFAEVGRCYASTSWGKDSTCMSHLVATSGVRMPLVYVRMRRWENPDCLTVRDAFLAEYGHLVDYDEYEVDGGARWWDAEADHKPRSGGHATHYFREADRRHGARHISGVRAEESRIRQLAQARWGDASVGACRPLGRWTAVHIYAYLHREDLPIHPAYAMSYGGLLDRRWLRVSPIGSTVQAHKNRADWETHYYPEIVRDGRGW